MFIVTEANMGFEQDRTVRNYTALENIVSGAFLLFWCGFVVFWVEHSVKHYGQRWWVLKYNMEWTRYDVSFLAIVLYMCIQFDAKSTVGSIASILFVSVISNFAQIRRTTVGEQSFSKCFPHNKDTKSNVGARHTCTQITVMLHWWKFNAKAVAASLPSNGSLI